MEHQVVEWLESRVSGSKNVGVVTRVDGAGNEGGGFGVGAGDGEEVGTWELLAGYFVREFEPRYRQTHDIGLSADGDETVDVFTDRDQDLASHVSTLLSARCLILDMNTSGSSRDEPLGQLHHGSQTTVASVGIGNDGTEVVHIGNLGALFLGGCDAFLPLLSVVEELSHE